MQRILACVILFDPEESVLQHINSYIDEVDGLLVVDNSLPSSEVCNKIEALYKNAAVIRNGVNVGVARALNQAANLALERKFSWLLTMDQDSHFEPGALKAMKAFLSEHSPLPGILAPFHRTFETEVSISQNISDDVRVAMTSGSLVNLEAFARCGSFDEKLFIDSVDHEYCLRLRRNGYGIVRLNTAILHHRIGLVVDHSLFGLRFRTIRRPATRHYYIMRNRLYIMKKYGLFDPAFFLMESWQMFKTFISVLMFDDQKIEKVNSMWIGWWHFIRGRYGKRSVF